MPNCFTILLFLLNLRSFLIAQQLISPCPRLFTYENNNTETDRWYGQLNLYDTDLAGVWLLMIFDKPPIQLGNWFGQVITESSTDYLILNPKFTLKSNSSLRARFYVRYNPNEAPPQLIEIRLNAKTVCPEGDVTTPAPQAIRQQFTKMKFKRTHSRTFLEPTTKAPQNNFINHQKAPSYGNEDDFFHGDISIILKGPGQFQKPQADTCGTVMKTRPLIYNGQETEEGEFPWHAAIYHTKGIDLTYICGASLISRLHLLTVAHCVTRLNSESPLLPEALVIYLGKYYLKQWSKPGTQDHHVKKITIHPQYEARSFSNDIAVLTLKSPAEITNFVRPVCLWDGSEELNKLVNKEGVVAGWGFDESGTVTDELSKATMPVVSLETCVYTFPALYSRFKSTTTFCAGFRNGTSVCNGDSGSGMVFPKPGTESRNPIWQIRGLISIGVALQNDRPVKCDPFQYVVFTDVAKYLRWIKESMK